LTTKALQMWNTNMILTTNKDDDNNDNRNQLWTIQMETHTISVSKLSDNGMSWLPDYLCLLLTYLHKYTRRWNNNKSASICHK